MPGLTGTSVFTLDTMVVLLLLPLSLFTVPISLGTADVPVSEPTIRGITPELLLPDNTSGIRFAHMGEPKILPQPVYRPASVSSIATPPLVLARPLLNSPNVTLRNGQI